MSYFVTGATGFIGGHFMKRLIKRRGTIYVLIRKGSDKKLTTLRKELGVSKDRVVGVHGDLSKPGLGISKQKVRELKGKIGHMFHLAALYNIAEEDAEAALHANVDGTRHAVKFAEAVGVKCFHHMSSIAAAGLYRGHWREDMFEEAKNLDRPYFRTKHEAEAIVRYESDVPYRIYRPAIVVGDSKTGEISKIDGPYYLFRSLKKIRSALPPWVPMVGIEGGRINIVPVDYVVDALDFLAHKPGLDGRCFHLTDPEPYRAGEVLNLFARVAHAPRFAMRIDYRMFNIVPKTVRDGLIGLPPIRRIIDTILSDWGIPRQVLHYIDYPTRFDCRDTLRELKGSGISCPRLEHYAATLWDYWARNLDPDLFRDRTLPGAVRDRVVMITGASSGIGRSAALKVARAGAKVILVARNVENLEGARAEIEAKGGQASIYPADVSDIGQCEKLVKSVLRDHGRIDVLINNAGRSIRRSIHNSYDRFHDFQRTMQINYFGAVRLILGVLPSMEANGGGHIINVSSIGVLANSPRFSAYVASKSALDSFSRCARPEFLDKNVHFTTINMPLVRTPMIGPTTFYNDVPTLSPEEAADLICKALIEKPKRVATSLGIFAQIITTITPQMADVVLNTAYKLFPESAAARGQDKSKDIQPSTEAVAFAALMRGVHW